jgi:hypothetical protein
MKTKSDNQAEVHAKHSPGNWEVLAGTVIRTTQGKTIATVPESSETGIDFWETRANARFSPFPSTRPFHHLLSYRILSVDFPTE